MLLIALPQPFADDRPRGSGALFQRCVRNGADDLWVAYCDYAKEPNARTWDALAQQEVVWAFRKPTVGMRLVSIRRRLEHAVHLQHRTMPALPTIHEIRQSLAE